MIAEDLDSHIKVIVVGNGAVGKTSMIQRFCKGGFGNDYIKTLGVDYVEKQDYRVDSIDDSVTMNVWDTAGQEEYDAVTAQYYRGADGCVLAFSTVDKASFNALQKWKKKVDDHCPDVPMVIVQNKIDLLSEAAVTNEEVEALATELRLKLFRVSVKDNTNVNEVFDAIVEAWHKNKGKQAVSETVGSGPVAETVDVAKPKQRGKEKKSGCDC